MQKKIKKYWAFFLSLIIHLCLMVYLISLSQPPRKIVLDDGLEIEWVDLEPEKDDELEKRQIVDQNDTPLNDETPLKDYKLSKNDQRVLRETKAANKGEFQNVANSAKSKTPTIVAVQKPTPKPEPQPQEAKKEEPPKEPGKNLSLADLRPSSRKFNPTPDRQPAAVVGVGAAVSQTDDYLKDVKEGSQTLLNTREFVYFTYYARIKRKLKQHWEPRIRHKILKLMRKGRRVASATDKITRLVITLNPAGKLTKVQVLDASGYNELDEAAIEAFRAAAPFPNPPKGIADSNGEIRINWDFVLES